MSAPIFISYSSKDQDIAETIYQALEARGQDCWISCRDVKPGENFQEAIVRALRGAKVMLLVFTSNANNSDEIKKELVLAGRHHVTVVPVRVEDVVPNDAFSYEFATRQWIDLFKNWEQEIELLSSRLEHMVHDVKPGEAAADPPVTSARRFPKKSSNQPLIWGAIAAAVIIVVGGGVFQLRPTPKPAIPVAAAPPVAAPPAAAPTVIPAPAPVAAAADRRTGAAIRVSAAGHARTGATHRGFRPCARAENCRCTAIAAAAGSTAASRAAAKSGRSRMAVRGRSRHAHRPCRVSERLSRRCSRSGSAVAARQPDPHWRRADEDV